MWETWKTWPLSLIYQLSYQSFPSLFLLSLFLSDFVCFPPRSDEIFCSLLSSFPFGGSTFLLGAGSLLLRKPNQLAKLDPDFCFTSLVRSCSWDLCKFSSMPSITFSSIVVMVLCLSGSSETGSPKALENCCSIWSRLACSRWSLRLWSLSLEDPRCKGTASPSSIKKLFKRDRFIGQW